MARVALAVLTLSCGLLFTDAVATAQTSGTPALPTPAGPFKVGRVTIHLTDQSRTEPLASVRSARELMVDVWYPAEPSTGPEAPYIDPAAFTRPDSQKRLRGFLRSAYEHVKAGKVRTNAVSKARFARSAAPSPVLIFSHGGGEARETYAAQLTELASYGYVVAAIAHTYEALLTMFPDERHVYLAPGRRWPPPTTSGVEGLPPSEEASPDQLRWWADDIRLVLDGLTRENGSSSVGLPFAGRLDLNRVGAFGHSAGGQAAAHACQIDSRLNACLNQDGLSGFAPYYLDARGWGMDQSFMLIARAPRADPPTAKELASMNMTIDQANRLLGRLKARQDETLRKTGSGSYRVLLNRTGTSHADFTDLPLLQAASNEEAAKRLRVLQVVREFTRAFFDKALRSRTSPLLDKNGVSDVVQTVERFPPATRPVEHRSR